MVFTYLGTMGKMDSDMKKSSKVLATIVIGTAILAGGASAADRSFDYSGFNAVEATSGLSVNVNVGPDFDVTAEALRDRHLDKLKIEMRGDTLVLSRKTSWSGLSLFGSSAKITVNIEMPSLTGAEATSGSTLVLQGELDQPLVVLASSGSTLKASGVSNVPVTLSASSGASTKIEGDCSAIEMDVSSGASVNAKGLECEILSARVSSGSSASAHASKSVNAKASSGASLSIYGDPQTQDAQSSSGASLSFR